MPRRPQADNADLDWFVPDFNVDLNAPASASASAHVPVSTHRHRPSANNQHQGLQVSKRFKSGSINKGATTSRQILNGLVALAGGGGGGGGSGGGGSNANSELNGPGQGGGGRGDSEFPGDGAGDPSVGLSGLFSGPNSDAGSGSGLMGNITDLFGQLGAAFGAAAAPVRQSVVGNDASSRASSRANSRRVGNDVHQVNQNAVDTLNEPSMRAAGPPHTRGANTRGSAGSGGDGSGGGSKSRSGSMVPGVAALTSGMVRALSAKRNSNRSQKSSPQQSPMGSFKVGIGTPFFSSRCLPTRTRVCRPAAFLSVILIVLHTAVSRLASTPARPLCPPSARRSSRARGRTGDRARHRPCAPSPKNGRRASPPRPPPTPPTPPPWWRWRRRSRPPA